MSNDAGRFKETNKWKTIVTKDLPECEAPGSVGLCYNCQ